MSKPLIFSRRSPFSIPSVPSSVSGRTPNRRMPTTFPFSCSGTMRAWRISSAWFSRILSTTPRSTLNSFGPTRWMPFLMSSPTPGAPPAGIGAGVGAGGAAAALASAGGLNIIVWQSWLPLVSHTRSQPMNFTVLPPISPPRRRSWLLPFSCCVSSAANDHSGSADAAMMSTFTSGQSGACQGSERSGGGTSADMSGMGTALSGPVTESNGLRARMASAVVACGLAEAGAGGRRAVSGGVESCFSSAPRLAPTTCMIPCASRNAAMATSARITAQKWRLRTLSMAMDAECPWGMVASDVPWDKRAKTLGLSRGSGGWGSTAWRPGGMGPAGRDKVSTRRTGPAPLRGTGVAEVAYRGGAMATAGKKGDSPLVAAAAAVDEELRAYDALAEEARRLDIEGEKSLRRATAIIQDSASRQDRIQERLRALVDEIEHSRTRQVQSLTALLEAARTLEARTQQHDAILQRFAALGESARACNELAVSLSQRRAAGLSDGEMLAGLVEIQTSMAAVVGEAEALTARAQTDRWPELARQVDSVRQQVLAAKNKLALAQKAMSQRVS